MSQIFLKIKDFFLKNEQKIVLVVAFCLISAVSFEFGVLQGQKWQQKPLIVEKPTDVPNGQENQNKPNSEAAALVQKASTQGSADQTKTANCAFVGSKNSNKFYLPTCSMPNASSLRMWYALIVQRRLLGKEGRRANVQPQPNDTT